VIRISSPVLHGDAGIGMRVDGTQDRSGRNMVMLLDTATGQTWISCVDKEEGHGWCRMFKSDTPTTGAAGPAPK
jgi:hypothetical protein